jgi:ABC-2 type transport system ATP-binding protein
MAEVPLVAVDGLVKRLGQRMAVADVTLTLKPGAIHGFVGGNGSGKTTTLRLLAGLLRPDLGEGHVLGFDLRRWGDQVRRHVGYMAQRPSLYAHLSVRQNLRFRADIYGLPDPRAVAERTMRSFGLDAYAGREVGALSEGWGRRLQLAAAVIHAPRLILLDEPTAGLDLSARQEVWRRIGQFAAAGAGLVISTHDLAEAERCTAISLFHGGRVLAQGTPAAVARQAPAEAFLLSGPEAHLLAPWIEAEPGIIAAYPHGGQLRVIARPSSRAALTARAEKCQATLAPAAMRLEDAALVLGRSPW